MKDQESMKRGGKEIWYLIVSPGLVVSMSPHLAMQRRLFSRVLWTAVVVGTAALVGCGQTEPPQFRLDMMKVVENGIAPAHQKAIANILGAMFGTPDQPFAMPEMGLDQRQLKMAAGPVRSDETGGKHGLYRRHCAHCHGISGDGLGPTAAILNPYPRDYRRGLFKFKSTYTAAQPTDDDLRRIVHDGIPGTAMPSFALLPPDEVDALVEYVKYLSMRGQMETALENYVFDEGLEPEDPLDPTNDPELRDIIINDLLVGITEPWQGAAEQVIVPADDALPPNDRTAEQLAASVDAGRELFYGTKANCVKCHGPTGLGDGQQDNFDDWSEANRKFIADTDALVAEIQDQREELSKLTGEERNVAEKDLEEKGEQLATRRELVAHILEPRRAIPRNLREGSFRGGRRQIDLFWRVFAGIPGMGMPASGPSEAGGQGTLSEQEMWQIVDYIYSLPFEPISRPQRPPVNVEAVN
jgi:mono/diheme cytochrome c family protein